MELCGDFMELYDDLMELYGDVMGFNSDLVGFSRNWNEREHVGTLIWLNISTLSHLLMILK